MQQLYIIKKFVMGQISEQELREQLQYQNKTGDE